MKTEYEVRVLEIDVPMIQRKLAEVHAEHVGAFTQRRYVYDFIPKIPGKWIRLRSNGKKTTLTIKHVQQQTIDGTKELETEVGDFDTMHEILGQLGYQSKAYQENCRDSYRLDGVEIEIDRWPRIPTYMEIEGSSKEDVERILTLLEIDKEQVTMLDVQSIYLKKYGINLEDISCLMFEKE